VPGTPGDDAPGSAAPLEVDLIEPVDGAQTSGASIRLSGAISGGRRPYTVQVEPDGRPDQLTAIPVDGTTFAADLPAPVDGAWAFVVVATDADGLTTRHVRREDPRPTVKMALVAQRADDLGRGLAGIEDGVGRAVFRDVIRARAVAPFASNPEETVRLFGPGSTLPAGIHGVLLWQNKHSLPSGRTKRRFASR
jgi:hypothetical protein